MSFYFTVGDYSYFGVGSAGFSDYTVPVLPTSFWKYDASTNTFYPLKNPTYGAGWGLGTFSIGNKGYSLIDNKLWEYDPTTDNWMQKATFPKKDTIYLPATFTIGSKAYICGFSYGTSGILDHIDDTLYEYDQTKDLWTQKSYYPGYTLNNRNAFSINNNGYILGGSEYGTNTNSFYKYNTDSNIWHGLSVYPSKSNGAVGIAYSCNNMGYVYFLNGELMQYDPVNDKWSRINDFPGLNPDLIICFGIGQKAYLGFGFTGGVSYHRTKSNVTNELWEYNP
ncbi:MAG: hypothetical protein P4L41_13940 [Flavipsychrobacter sp.]|nr:hypothetical protein [Flavipsychrobacter sp.]